MPMISLALGIVHLAHLAGPVTLTRKFALGEKLSYKFENVMILKQRDYRLETFYPERQGFEYGFTTEVTGLKDGGFCEMLYDRPYMVAITGANAEHEEIRSKINMSLKAKLTLSPINEITAVVDLAGKPAKPKSGKWISPAFVGKKAEISQDMISSMIQDVVRLSAFVGGVDSGLDLAPPLPVDEVNVGDTWKKTISYAPQKVKGAKEGKMSVQRLDYVYTYKGKVQENGKTYERIEGSLNLDTDAVNYFNSFYENASESPLRSVKFKVAAKILFDLDPTTYRTLKTTAHCDSAFQIFIKDIKDQAYEEAKIESDSTLRLASSSSGKTTQTAPVKPKKKSGKG